MFEKGNIHRKELFVKPAPPPGGETCRYNNSVWDWKIGKWCKGKFPLLNSIGLGLCGNQKSLNIKWYDTKAKLLFRACSYILPATYTGSPNLLWLKFSYQSDLLCPHS